MATPAQISSLSSCYSCVADWRAAVLYLLATNAGIMDPATISANSACYRCVPDFEAAALYLLDTIASAPAPVTDQVQCGPTAPVAAPTGTCSLYFDTVTEALYAWNGSAWILKA